MDLVIILNKNYLSLLKLFFKKYDIILIYVEISIKRERFKYE